MTDVALLYDLFSQHSLNIPEAKPDIPRDEQTDKNESEEWPIFTSENRLFEYKLTKIMS